MRRLIRGCCSSSGPRRLLAGAAGREGGSGSGGGGGLAPPLFGAHTMKRRSTIDAFFAPASSKKSVENGGDVVKELFK